ncbi:MAG: SRPBCC domain-containing protein [Rickettsia aeschlimannii]
MTSKFWFTKSSDKLEVKKQSTWTWKMYGFSVQINMQEIEKNKKILIDGMRIKTLTLVEWQVTSISSEETFVTITNTGFIGDEVVKQIIFQLEDLSWCLPELRHF